MSKEAKKVQDYLHSIGFTSALVRLGHGTTELEVTGYYDPYKMLAILEKLADIGYKSDDVDGDFRETSYGLVADVTKVKVNESKSINESLKEKLTEDNDSESDNTYICAHCSKKIVNGKGHAEDCWTQETLKEDKLNYSPEMKVLKRAIKNIHVDSWEELRACN